MADLQYNFLGDNFTKFLNIETPKVLLEMPLMDNPLDISDWASRVTEDGTPIVKSNVKSKLVVNNSEETPIIQQRDTQQGDISLNLTGRKKKAVEFFSSKLDSNGNPILTPHQIAGLVGNLIRESNLNPLAENGHSKAIGLAQWLGDRKKKLISKYGKNPTFELQLDFIWEELNTTHRRGLEALRNSLTVEEAAANAFGWYEFSVGPKGAIAEMRKYGLDGLKSYNKGIEYAKSLMS